MALTRAETRSQLMGSVHKDSLSETAGVDTILTPPGAQCPATRGKPQDWTISPRESVFHNCDS
jgi:hypothetical protein